ncbi:hypothetical protein [Mycolicibacterium llatzerense]|uniref:hypothetical protein n=1 Tax=Mycolicibacterium llatzerense TaxID=280871 RepID=UPI0008DDD2BB|nr:hypothetical protein [Mycolicibacterium llatzerense]
MSGNPDDPNFSSVPSSLPGPVSGSSATGTNLAQLRADMATMAETNKGSAVNAAKDRIAEIAAAGRALEMNLLIIETAAKELKEAQAAWEKAAEGAKKADLDKADEEVQAAKTKLAQAQTIENQARDAVNAAQAGIDACEPNTDAWYDAMRTWSAACTARDAAVEVTKAAQTALDEARKKAADLKAKNKAANDDLRRAYKSIAAKLAGLDRSVLGGRERVDGGTGRGTGRPGGTVNVPGYKEPSSPGTERGVGAGGAGAGGGAPKGGKEMPSMPSTPAKPSETGSGKTGGTPDATSQALAQLLHGQQQQQPQAAAGTPQQAQATPQQTAPTQEQKKPGEKSELEKEAEKNGNDLLRIAAGEDPEKVLGGVPLAVAPALNAVGPQSAPSGQNGTSFRPGYTPAGTTTGGNPIPAQPAPTTGHSVTGMNTRADVTGSSTPPASAFDSTKTNTSAAHGATAAEQQQSQQAQRTAGAPMSPMMGPMGGAPSAGAAPRAKDDKDSQVLASNGGLDHGQTAVSEAVRGGTIAQNRDGKAA